MNQRQPHTLFNRCGIASQSERTLDINNRLLEAQVGLVSLSQHLVFGLPQQRARASPATRRPTRGGGGAAEDERLGERRLLGAVPARARELAQARGVGGTINLERSVAEESGEQRGAARRRCGCGARVGGTRVGGTHSSGVRSGGATLHRGEEAREARQCAPASARVAVHAHEAAPGASRHSLRHLVRAWVRVRARATVGVGGARARTRGGAGATGGARARGRARGKGRGRHLEIRAQPPPGGGGKTRRRSAQRLLGALLRARERGAQLGAQRRATRRDISLAAEQHLQWVQWACRGACRGARRGGGTGAQRGCSGGAARV